MISIRPYFEDQLPFVWLWLNEHRQATMDDTAPRSLDELTDKYRRDRASGTLHYAVMNGGSSPKGCIWFELAGDFVFIGHLVFSHDLPPEYKGDALRQCVRLIWAAGARKIVWMVYADNLMFRNFLKKRISAVEEGRLRQQARRQGQLIDVILMANFPEDLPHD